jgi:excisionase family DNA binding protein
MEPAAPANVAQSATLTSREAGQLCGVSFRTVIRWIERGELQGYRLPGRGDYRISSSVLRAFMRKHGMHATDVPTPTARRVLIVDDERPVAAAIGRVLRRAGFDVKTASDGFQAGSLLHQFQPLVMILDLRMPGLDGFGVLRFLRENPPERPPKVLAVSGVIDGALREAVRQGAHDSLEKPFLDEHLLQAVRRLADPDHSILMDAQ